MAEPMVLEEEEDEDSFVIPDALPLEGNFSEISEDVVLNATSPFMTYIVPILALVSAVCCSEDPPFNYTCVIIDDEGGTARGPKRLKYFYSNNGPGSHVTDAYFACRMLLVKNQCRVTAPEFQELLKCYDTAAVTGHEDSDSNATRLRVTAIAQLCALLSDTQDVIDYNYSDPIRTLAEQCSIELAEAPQDAPPAEQKVLPFFLFYEVCIKTADTVSVAREYVGYGYHNDFPALRLLRILWSHSGAVDYARRTDVDEVGGEEIARRDNMYGLLTL